MQENDSGKQQYQKPTPEKREQLEQVVEGGVIVLTTGVVGETPPPLEHFKIAYVRGGSPYPPHKVVVYAHNLKML